MNLRIEKLIVKDIIYQLEQAEWDLGQDFKEGARYRLKNVEGWCVHLLNRLADDIKELS